MEERIVKFIAALRAAGVRVSLAESADAFQAINSMGIKDRQIFRLSLQTTLIKDASNLPIFEELFPIFFSSSENPPMTNPSDDLSPEEARMLAEALRQFSEQLRKMMEKLLRGEQLSQDELDRLGKMVGLSQMDNLHYREWMVQRMKKALRFKEVQEALKELAETLAQMGMDKQRAEQLIQLMQANQHALEDQLRQYAGQRIAENMSERPPEDGIDSLMNRPFNALSDQDMERLRKEVQRLANALKTRVALRQKRAKSGQLDAKATIRANLKHGNVPIELKHRERTLKPKLVILCDVSTSMRYCSELMLSLLYHMQDLISKTYAFAFINRLEYISPDFSGKEVHTAVAQVLERMPAGYYNTDLGSSLADFQRSYLDAIDSRTTFILVGDGRNNYNDPRLDIFRALARRCRRTIWINPEAAMLWGSGDSDMLKYAPNCDVVLQAGNLAQLTAAVDRLLLA
ncbi:MAG: VWA domain-containing protein [Anaerolineales bacterium]|nr:VWA domain-containing protein [Anaerolineales bacterium]